MNYYNFVIAIIYLISKKKQAVTPSFWKTWRLKRNVLGVFLFASSYFISYNKDVVSYYTFSLRKQDSGGI